MSELHYQCKLCNLIKSDRDLWIEVHRKVLKDNIPRSVVCRWLNDRVKLIKGLEKLSFNNANFTKHFSSHVTDMKKMRSFISQPVNDSVSFTEAQKDVAEAVSSVPEEEDDYKVLTDVVSLLRGKITKYGEVMNKREAESNRVPTMMEIENLQKLISGFISIKNDLNKLKTSDKIVSMAMRTALEMMVDDTLNRMEETVREIKASFMDLPNHDDAYHKDVLYKIEQAVSKNVGKAMKSSIIGIMEKISDTYGVKL